MYLFFIHLNGHVGTMGRPAISYGLYIVLYTKTIVGVFREKVESSFVEHNLHTLTHFLADRIYHLLKS